MRFNPALILSILLVPVSAHAEDDALLDLARQHQYAMTEKDGAFAGPGWDLLSERAAGAQQVLAGEDHFTNEIPRLIGAIAGIGSYDHFYIEIDPFSTRVIENSFRDMNPEQRAAFRREFGDLYSFYALEPEYVLLEQVQASGAGLLGADQVVMYADRLVYGDWVTRTENDQAREIYANIVQQSQSRLNRFLENPGQPDFSLMYFLTAEFAADLDRLSELELSDEEQKLIEATRLSMDIYHMQSHRKRVQLLKHQLMTDYPRWIGGRTLFKYGANHLARGESYLTVQDIGALIANLAEAAYQESFHVMIIGESGEQGSPFRGFPATQIDPEDFYLKPLQPLFSLTEGPDWAVFDLLPLRRAYERGELEIDSVNLVRVIKGYDVLVLIPVVTPAQFPAFE
jgi:hypothetical protein